MRQDRFKYNDTLRLFRKNEKAEQIIEIFRKSARSKNILIINPGYENYIRLMVFSCYDLFKHDISQTDWKRRDLFTGILVAYSKSIGGNFDDLYSISEILYLRQDFEKVISKSHNLNYL